MAKRIIHILTVLIVLFFFGKKSSAVSDLFQDLSIVEYWNQKIYERYPTHYNFLLEGGLFVMPTALIGNDGELGIGFAYFPPYRVYSARAEIHPQIEVTLNYRIFTGVDDPVLTPLGFGDLSDKGANIKFALLKPEDSGFLLPGVAIGFQDFLGTRAFKSRYIVFTKVFLEEGFEVSLGFGEWRIRGLFGGVAWMPSKSFDMPCLFKNFILAAEWDATPYHSTKREPHPEGRIKKSAINYGIKWRLFDMVDLSACYIRGDALALQASLFYNLGETKGFIPKVKDPLPYQAPIVREPLGILRPESIFAAEISSAFQCQGFNVLKIHEERGPCFEKILRINVINLSWRNERETRNRLEHLLGSIFPSDVESVIVVVEDDMMPVHEYHFYLPYVVRFMEKEIGFTELNLTTPMREVTIPFFGKTLYRKHKDWINAYLLPDFYSFFGSARGKFKYSLGVALALSGFLGADVYYSCILTQKLFADLEDIHDIDRLNPSQIINVKSDIINYFKQGGIQLEELYLNKIWNLGKGYFFEGAVGYFDRMYAGLFGEILYYPVGSAFAIGFEGSLLKKRTFSGIGFTNKIRRLEGFTPRYENFLGSQAFMNLYYDMKECALQFGIKAGRFLAKDLGIRFELSRYFDSGLRITLWYTRTDGHDRINGETYFDKGISISMPLDIFYTHSSRKRFTYGMSAWLRDVGQFTSLKESLYERVNNLRQ